MLAFAPDVPAGAMVDLQRGNEGSDGRVSLFKPSSPGRVRAAGVQSQCLEEGREVRCHNERDIELSCMNRQTDHPPEGQRREAKERRRPRLESHERQQRGGFEVT